MRKKVVGKTFHELVNKLAKNEGNAQFRYGRDFDKSWDYIKLYDIKPDYDRNQFVALRKN